MQGNLAKPLLPAVCNLEESCLDCKAKQLALSATELRKGWRGGSQLLGAQVTREDLVFDLQHGSKEERVAESANISDWLEFRI